MTGAIEFRRCHPTHSRPRFATSSPNRKPGLAVVDIPADVTAALGGLKQMRVRAIVNGNEFTSNTMPAGGGKLALSLSKQILKNCNLSVGDQATFEIHRPA